MKLQVYVLDRHTIDLRPAPVERVWMDNSPERFAYRCLPLSIANTHGWELICPGGFSATWNGESDLKAINVQADDTSHSVAVSHFGTGVLTFHVPCLFRTDPGYDLLVQGPINAPKDGISALCGIVEADWAPYTFTMNWIFTRPNATVRFERGEPFCHIFPVRRGLLETVTPELHVISENTEIQEQHERWQFMRAAFNSDLKRTGTQAQKEKWQRLYHRGVKPDGTAAPIKDHHTRLRLKPFVKSQAYIGRQKH
jgi:hypothetical protein